MLRVILSIGGLIIGHAVWQNDPDRLTEEETAEIVQEKKELKCEVSGKELDIQWLEGKVIECVQSLVDARLCPNLQYWKGERSKPHGGFSPHTPHGDDSTFCRCSKIDIDGDGHKDTNCLQATQQSVTGCTLCNAGRAAEDSMDACLEDYKRAPGGIEENGYGFQSGTLYRRQQFIEFFGGTSEWDSIAEVEQHPWPEGYTCVNFEGTGVTSGPSSVDIILDTLYKSLDPIQPVTESCRNLMHNLPYCFDKTPGSYGRQALSHLGYHPDADLEGGERTPADHLASGNQQERDFDVEQFICTRPFKDMEDTEAGQFLAMLISAAGTEDIECGWQGDSSFMA